MAEKYGVRSDLEVSTAIAVKRHDEERQAEIERLFNIAYFVCKEGLSFKKYPKLCKLQIKNSVALGSNYLTDVACQRFIISIADVLKDDMRHTIQLSRFLSVLCDGSTDSSILEEEIVYLRFLKNGLPVTQFAGIKNPEKPDASGIFNAIENVICTLIIDEDLKMFYKKLVNANFDGASVMSGHKSGVQARLKEKQKGLIYTHCVAHRLELAVLDSIKFDTYLSEFDEGINNIFHFYYYSPVRRKELKDLAQLLNDEFKQLGRLKNIRWIASRDRALKLLETNYKVLIYDLESKSYGTDETLKKALGYLKFLKQPRFLFYLHFFEDLVEAMRTLSLIFQNDLLLACEVPRKIDECCAVIDALSVVPGDASNRLQEQIKSADNDETLIYKEVQLDKPDGRRAQKVDHSFDGYQNLYNPIFTKIIESVQDYLHTRFMDFNKEPLCSLVKLFDIQNWPNDFKASNELRKWGFQEVKKVTEFYRSNEFISSEEEVLASKHWPLFRERVS